jgi:hypothetical protein
VAAIHSEAFKEMRDVKWAATVAIGIAVSSRPLRRNRYTAEPETDGIFTTIKK